MVLIFKTLVDHWRERLAWIEDALIARSRDSWRLQFERKILRFLVRRFAYSAPPRQARALDRESHEQSERLVLSPETQRRLGIAPPKPPVVVEAPAAEVETPAAMVEEPEAAMDAPGRPQMRKCTPAEKPPLFNNGPKFKNKVDGFLKGYRDYRRN